MTEELRTFNKESIHKIIEKMSEEIKDVIDADILEQILTKERESKML